MASRPGRGAPRANHDPSVAEKGEALVAYPILMRSGSG